MVVICSAVVVQELPVYVPVSSVKLLTVPQSHVLNAPPPVHPDGHMYQVPVEPVGQQ